MQITLTCHSPVLLHVHRAELALNTSPPPNNKQDEYGRLALLHSPTNEISEFKILHPGSKHILVFPLEVHAFENEVTTEIGMIEPAAAEAQTTSSLLDSELESQAAGNRAPRDHKGDEGRKRRT